MRLKVITTTLVVAGIALLLYLFYVMGQRPAEGTDKALANWGVTLLVTFAATTFTWLGAGACAVILARRARREFVEEEKKALRGLIEGTIRDHEERQKRQ